MKAPVIISLGGSLVVPDGIDVGFVRSFKAFITERVAEGERFIIILGGGKVCRNYQNAARELGVSSGDELDWVGIHATRLNANFFRIVMDGAAELEVVTDPRVLLPMSRPVLVGAGFEPGNSTDFDAVEIAKTYGAKKIINLSNIDYAYDKDPKKFPDAVKIERATWREFRKVLPLEWSPGVNAPFDPIAAARAEELGLEVAIMNGRNLENLANYLDGKSFKGTIISM